MAAEVRDEAVVDDWDAAYLRPRDDELMMKDGAWDWILSRAGANGGRGVVVEP